MIKEKKDITLTIRITPEIDSYIKSFAPMFGWSRGEAIRQLLLACKRAGLFQM